MKLSSKFLMKFAIIAVAMIEPVFKKPEIIQHKLTIDELDVTKLAL